MDNKKKLVLGVLALAILAIGAFQFTGGGEEPAPVKKEAPVAKVQEAPKPVANIGLIQLAARDPFKPGRLPGALDQQPTQPDEQPKQTPPPTSEFGPNPGPGFNPMVPGVGEPGQNGTAPAGVAVEPMFKYTLVGVVMGDMPVAVFADATGNQRLITLGGSLDGDSKVVAIEKGKVTVKFQKDTLKLTIGGTASAKF